MSNLAYRKQYALKCLAEGRTNTRAFDSCFENGDGDKVAEYILKQIDTLPHLKATCPQLMAGEYNYKDYKAIIRAQDKIKALENVERNLRAQGFKFYTERNAARDEAAHVKNNITQEVTPCNT